MNIKTERGAQTRAKKIQAEIAAIDIEIANAKNEQARLGAENRKYNRECALYDVHFIAKKYGWSVG